MIARRTVGPVEVNRTNRKPLSKCFDSRIDQLDELDSVPQRTNEGGMNGLLEGAEGRCKDCKCLCISRSADEVC